MYHIACPCKHYTVLFLSSFLTRRQVNISYRNRETAYDVLDTDTIRKVKERKSNKERVDVDDVDLAHRGRKLDDDQQWWQTGVFEGDFDIFDIFMYKR